MMNHLTTREVLQIVDGTIANGERTKLIVHLEACQRCRQEVQLHRNLGRAIKELPLAEPSRGFTGRISGTILGEKKKTWVSKIVDNLGNLVAMGLVLTAVWYALSMTPATTRSTEPSFFSKAFGVYVEYYAKARDAATKEIGRVVGEPKKEQPSKAPDVATLTLISLLILIAIDRFVGRRLIRIRS